MRQLHEMRLSGKRPAGFIVVTDSYEIAKNARLPHRGLYAVVFRPDMPLDWTALRGLVVHLVTYSERSKVAATAQAILEAEPAAFTVTLYSDPDVVEHDRIIDAAR